MSYLREADIELHEMLTAEPSQPESDTLSAADALREAARQLEAGYVSNGRAQDRMTPAQRKANQKLLAEADALHKRADALDRA